MASFSLQWLGLMLDTSAKSLLLGTIAWATIRLLKIRNCHVRHRIWTGVLVGMLVLPLLSPVIPQLQLPVPVPRHFERSGAESGHGEASADSSSDRGSPTAIEGRLAPVAGSWSQNTAYIQSRGREVRIGSNETSEATSIGNSSEIATTPVDLAPTSGPGRSGWQILQRSVAWLAVVWLVGATGVLARLAFGVRMARRLRQASLPITVADLSELGVSSSCWPAEGCSALLLECSLIRVPLTLGLLRPVVLLPAEWLEWSTEKLESVLLHEGTHVVRGDSAIALFSELNLAMNWFNPLAWWVRQHLAALAEEACDDAAIASIGDRTTYARHLLEVAAAVSTTPGRLFPITVSMARQSNVESRINSILDFTRPLSKRPTWFTTLLVLLLAGPMIALAAALKPGARAAAPGSPTGESASHHVESTSTSVALAEASDKPQASVAEKATKPATSTDKAGTADASLHYSGTVLDEKGQPVEGARVMLNYWRFQDDKTEPDAVRTDASGRFEFARRKSDFSDSSEEKPWTFAQIVATKPGLGFAAATSIPFETTGQIVDDLPTEAVEYLKREGLGKDRVLKLDVDLPIRGRIVDTEGRPVAGALIEPFNADEGSGGSLDAWEAATKKPGANFYSVLPELRRLYGSDFVNGPIDRTLAPVKTDADGVFTLSGVGRERLVSAVLSGPGIESSLLRLRTRKGQPIKLVDSEYGGDRFFTYYPAEFTHVAGPSQPVEGVVTDLRTGKPIEGVFVRGERTATYVVGGNAGFIRDTTDKEGRFRLEGFPLGTNQFVVLPKTGSGYLPAGIEVKTTIGNEPLVSNVSLTPAIRARGTVTERASGKPIRGYAEYFVFSNNPALQETRNYRIVDLRWAFRTDAEGRFEIPVLPGKGIITFSATNHETYPRGEGADKIDAPPADSGTTGLRILSTQPYFVVPTNYHGLIGIDPAADAQTIDVSLTLTPLQSFRGRVLAADGGSVEKYVLFGENAPSNWYERDRATFEVKGYLPRYGRRLMAFDRKTDSVGVLDVTGDPPEMAEIRLKRASRIVGRVVDDDGQPIAGARLDNDLLSSYQSSPISEDEHWAGKFDPERADFVVVPGHHVLTDVDGRFELVGVMPGLKYSARVLGTRKVGNEVFPTILGTIFTDVVAKPGERRDLGDVKIVPEKPRMMPAPKGQSTPDKKGTKPENADGESKPGATP